MLVPILHNAALTIALAASLSSNIIVAPLQPKFEGNNDLNSIANASSSTWLSASSSRPVSTAAVIQLPFRQYDTADDIPESFYKSNKVIRGRVVKVTDGDTIRIRHTPLYPLSKDEKGCIGKKLTECTIAVRLYAVDAPETAKFGNPGMPYAKEASEYMSDKVKDKVVRVKLLRKDQYSRVVGSVNVRNKYLPFLKTDMSASLLERGYASIYTGGGAEYDGRRDVLEKKLLKAQKKKEGIWSNGVDGYVDPASYKREMRAKKNAGGK